MITISIANLKGGVGKTTTAAHIAAGLAMDGVKVLVVDLDPQGHVSLLFGIKRTRGLFDLIVNNDPISSVVVKARENLYILPGDRDSTDRVRQHITTTLKRREGVIQKVLSKARYDVIIIDTAPSFDILQMNSLEASNWIVIPTRLDSLAVDGVNQILGVMKEVIEDDHTFDGYSVLPTFYDRTTSETADQFKMMVEAYGDHVLPPIPQDTHVREASAYGQTLWEYAPRSRALQGYIVDGMRIGGYIQVVSLLREAVGI